MPALDTTHTWSLTIGGVDYYPYLLKGTLRVVEAEGSQIDTLTCQLEDTGWATDPSEWMECILTADGTTKLFGGYVVTKKPMVGPGLTNLQWTINAESYLTLASRSPRIRKSYTNATVRAIATDLFSQAGLAGFDTTTHVSNAVTLTKFTAAGILLNEALDKLVEQGGASAAATWAYRIDADKKLWLGPASSDAAPFNIADIRTPCDYVTTFPPLSHPDATTDATQIRNRITVRGGTSASAIQTDNFTGDGSTTLFKLTYAPVRYIESISKAGVWLRYGWDWVDGWYDENGDGYDVLVDFEAGTLRFPDAAPPAGGAAVVCKYRYDVAITAVRTSAASYAQYGMYFDYEHEDASLTSATDAELAGDALLAQYAFGSLTGSVQVERLGIRAGQTFTMTYPLLGLSGGYVARQVTMELVAEDRVVRLTIQFGNTAARLSRTVKTGQPSQSAYYQPANGGSAGGTRYGSVNGYDGVGTGDFIPP